MENKVVDVDEQEVNERPAGDGEVKVGQVIVPQSLCDLLSYQNGTPIADPEHAESMFVHPNEHLFLESGMEQRNFVKNRMSNEEIIRVFMANYINLTTVDPKYSRAHAAFITAMRIQALQYGLYVPFESRCVFKDEVTFQDLSPYVTATDGKSKVLTNIGGALKTAQQHFVIATCMSALIFYMRGHHYKEDMDSYLNKVFKASYPSAGEPPVPFRIYLRQWIHPFGVAPVWSNYRQWAHKGMITSSGLQQLPFALQIRKDSMPAGAAALGLAEKILRQMEMEKWHEVFHTRYQDAIDTIHAAYIDVSDDGTAYHVAPVLYGKQRKELTLAVRAVDLIKPFLLGYLDIQDETSMLKKQKALSKGADGCASIREQFAGILRKEVQQQKDKASIQQFLARVDHIVDMQAEIRQKAEQLSYTRQMVRLNAEKKRAEDELAAIKQQQHDRQIEEDNE